MSRHKRTKHTLEIHYAQALIVRLAHNQYKRACSNMQLDQLLSQPEDWEAYYKAADRWIYAPDRWHDCPTHRLTKYTPIQHTVEYIIKFCNNKPADWSTILWTNYMNNLYERYSRFD